MTNNHRIGIPWGGNEYLSARLQGISAAKISAIGPARVQNDGIQVVGLQGKPSINALVASWNSSRDGRSGHGPGALAG
jgi:hypothetical protein